MKHLFYIHSYITYYVALEVIKHLKLNNSDCVFMYGRKFRPVSPPFGIKQVDLPFTHHPVNSFAVERMFWKGWQKLRRFDRFVEQVTNGSEFKLYTNQTGIDFIRLFISHHDCKGYSFLEEGIASYYTSEKINTEVCPPGSSTLFFKALLQLNFLGRLLPEKWFYSMQYDAVYGLSEASFPEFQRKVTLHCSFQNNLPLPAYGHILVLDATAEYEVTSTSSMLSALEEVLQYLVKTGVKKLWVRYHPDQANSLEARKLYEEAFGGYSVSLAIEEVPQDISLELISGNGKNTETVFYVFLSSAAIYAAMCGKEVYSFASYISKLDQRYRLRVEGLPDVFRQKVTFL